MKQFILILTLIIISFTGFAQPSGDISQSWKNSLEEIHNQPELKVFPNPCTEKKLTIEIDKDELTEIRISNITGKMVIFKEFLIPVNKINLVLENTPNGIYLVQVKTSLNKMIAKKLIVSGN